MAHASRRRRSSSWVGGWIPVPGGAGLRAQNPFWPAEGEGFEPPGMSGHGFKSGLRELDAYLAFKKTMGFSGASRIWHLKRFDAHCAEGRPGHLRS